MTDWFVEQPYQVFKRASRDSLLDLIHTHREAYYRHEASQPLRENLTRASNELRRRDKVLAQTP